MLIQKKEKTKITFAVPITQEDNTLRDWSAVYAEGDTPAAVGTPLSNLALGKVTASVYLESGCTIHGEEHEAEEIATTAFTSTALENIILTIDGDGNARFTIAEGLLGSKRKVKYRVEITERIEQGGTITESAFDWGFLEIFAAKD